MGRGQFNAEGESVIVAGGSQGLGRELALLLAAQGANVTIIARSPGPLEETRQELLKHVKHESQTISSFALDLADAAKVEEYIASLESPPTVLFCVAGGAAADLGFFADISTRNIQACMEKNYFSAAFIAHAVFRRWTKEPVASPTRHLIFTSSTAAFLGFPGYSAYAPTKTATRALADTLRQEALLYSSQQEIKVHCTFPGTFYSEGFYEEQKNKPQLLKEMEGTTADEGGLTTKRIAEITIQGLQKGQFFINMDGDTDLLMNNMRGPSPRDSPIRDWIVGLVGSLAWPFYRVKFDKMTVRHGKEMLAKGEEAR
ncbi:putative steroid dehydrogenase [Aspergillus stella-maris]|uniref:putative steroid dehydrogenase n=1 Tax=Aspergillus stella-maris TaxID=1810926 RepID=UPI003CCCC51E